MSYRALYRKWRPQTFADVVGQKAITDTLKNALKRGTVSHAYLFAGPRGTGKTSCALILAKALNCTNLQDGEPCNECANCKAADEGALADIIQIDAASNNGVDEIRTIRDQVKYAPTQGQYKVYIIDEVHMLSMGAFNALLKTLEEPPANVVFILATTELQKVPATIISRTQRYRFKRIQNKDLLAQMEKILAAEKIAYDDEALAVIAQVADGGMRDALSILDQLVALDNDKINYQDALEVTGFAAQGDIEQLLALIAQDKSSEALQQAARVLKDGATAQNVLTEIIELLSRLLLVEKTGEQEPFASPDFAEKMSGLPASRMFKLIDLANDRLHDLRYTNQQQLPLTVFIVQASQEQADSKPAADQAALTALQNKVQELEDRLNSQPAAPAPAKKKAAPADPDNRKQVYHVLANATKEDLAAVREVWGDAVSKLSVSERALTGVLEPVAASPDQVVLKCKYKLWFERANKNTDLVERLEAELGRMCKHNYGIVLVADSSWLQVRKSFLAAHKDELLARKKKPAAAKTDDSKQVVKKAQDLFGKELVHVHDKSEE
jgi:DNA polymerase-3 subunit gamma/tau